MTRKEKLEKAATKYAQDKYLPVQTAQSFKAGAKWADNNNNMKVFGLYPDVPYGGGIVLIAANSLEEAKELATKDEYIEYYGNVEQMEEIEEFSANVDTPKIIINSWYIE